jgi:DNA-binding SARP family transcriptional activator
MGFKPQVIGAGTFLELTGVITRLYRGAAPHSSFESPSAIHGGRRMHRYHLRILGGLQLSATDDGAERQIDVQLKPLALLAFVALHARALPVRRDTIIALFWPNVPSEHARLALRQALHHLRHAIGADLIVARPDDTLGLAPDACRCDAVELDAALARGDAPAAAKAYAGPLLDGVHIRGAAPELDQWLDDERRRLACVATQAVWTAATDAEKRGDTVAAAHWTHRALALAPDDEEMVRRAAQLLERIGANAAAHIALTTFVARLAKEYDAEPAAETRELLVRLESTTSARSFATPDSSPRPAEAPAIAPANPRANRSLWRVAVGLAAVLVVVALAYPRVFHGAPRSHALADSAVADGNVVSRSPVARRLYEEGLDRLSVGRREEASRLFRSALREDSTCAVCARRAGEALREDGSSEARTVLREAAKSAARAPRREQVLSRYELGSVSDVPGLVTLTDSLAASAPSDVEGQIAHASALMSAGRPAEALLPLRRIAAGDRGDSSATIGPDRPAADVWRVLVTAFWNADSIPAATVTAREWTSRHPHSDDAWTHLVDALGREGRYAEAQSTLAWLAARSPNDAAMLMARARLAIREGQYGVADSCLRLLERFGRSTEADALWWHTISLRNQGRQQEALDLAQGQLRRARDSDTGPEYIVALAEGQALFELGRFRAAADRFRFAAAHAEPNDSGLPATMARKRTWLLTHAGTALAAARDTVSLIALIDTVMATGAKSGFVRDPRLHYYLRGLLWCTRGQPDSAERALRASLTSLSEGFTRENAELAALLIGQHRAAEAIPLVRLGLQGPMESSNAYITRTQLQALMARAFTAAGQPDSAAAYRLIARRAWRTGLQPPPLRCGRPAR